MRKIVSGLFIALDGVVEAPNKWQEHFDEDMGEAMMAQQWQPLLYKKETGRCPGGSTTGEPRLRGVWGKSWVQNTSYRARRGWLNCSPSQSWAR
jgi:hypothetical protein